MSLLSKTPLRCDGAMKLSHRLSPRSIELISKWVQGEIQYLMDNFDTPEIRKWYIANPTAWTLKNENPLPSKIQNKLRKYLKRCGYGLSIEHFARNELSRFGYITKHNDSHIWWKWSTIFIPILLPRGESVYFWHESNPESKYELNIGDIMVFDQNHNHALDLIMKTTDEHMGYGLVLFLEELSEKILKKED